MNFRNALVQGGLMHREIKNYEEQQAQVEHAGKVRAHGVKVMESQQKDMEAKDALRPGKAEIERIQQDIAKNEALWSQENQGADQALRSGDLRHRAAMQPGQQQMERNNQSAGLTQSATAAALAPGAAQIATGEQDTKLTNLRETQAVNLYNLMKLGDKDGAMKLMNDSQILHPGRKFSDIQTSSVPKLDGSGSELVFKLVPADGGKSIYVPVQRLEALSRKHGSQIMKSGNNIVRINQDGTATPIYEADQYGTVSEGGTVFNKRTGQPPAGGGAAAGGISPKENTRINDSVKMSIDKVILPKYGGRFEGGMFFPDEKNKDVALRAQVLAEKNIREKKMNPIEAANAAIDQAEREKKLGTPPGAPASGAAAGVYTGPTPWRR